VTARTLAVLARIAALERQLMSEAAAARVDCAFIKHLNHARANPKRK
jgi:hypothetical protein